MKTLAVKSASVLPQPVADKAFIGEFDKLDVEPDRKLPLAMTRDAIQDGVVKWRGLGVINPFTDDGGLVHDLKRIIRA